MSAFEVKDMMDTAVLDTSVTNIPASAAAPVQVVGELAATCERIDFRDGIGGKYIGVYSGAVGVEVLECIIGGPGEGQQDVLIQKGKRISLRNMANAAIVTGELVLHFMGKQ